MNELMMVWHNTGELWWVERPDLNNTAPTSGHASENSVTSENFDTIIKNDGTLEDLYEKVERLLV